MSKQQSVDQAFKDIDKQFDATQKKNKYLKHALLTPIHEKYPYAQNGITAMIASMGSGKTYTYLKLMKQQEVLFDDAFYELIVICSTSNKFDATVNAFKPLITKSKLVAIKDTELLEFLNKYMRRILKFNALNKYMINNKDVNLVNGIGCGAGSYIRDSGLFAGTLIAALETHTCVSNYRPRNKPEDVAKARAQLKAVGGEDFVTPDDSGFAELFQQHIDAFEQKRSEYRAEQARRMKSFRW